MENAVESWNSSKVTTAAAPIIHITCRTSTWNIADGTLWNGLETGFSATGTSHGVARETPERGDSGETPLQHTPYASSVGCRKHKYGRTGGGGGAGG